MKHRLFAALPLIMLGVNASAGSSNMQPGLWEITTETSMAGMPMKLPPQTLRHCYTAADLAQAKNAVPQSGDGHCKIQDYQLKGNTATWTIECTGETSMHGTGTMTSTATTYTGSMKSVMTQPDGRIEMTNTLHGKRLGNCH